jgi:hypothetical protein
MFVPHRPSQTHMGYLPHTSMADKPDVRPSVFIPTVYEQVTAEPVQWEYHVLTIDPRETALPDADQLNTLGKEGWILVSILDESASGKGHRVHYYFVRQSKD